MRDEHLYLVAYDIADQKLLYRLALEPPNRVLQLNAAAYVRHDGQGSRYH